MRVLADLPVALERLGDADAAVRLRRPVQGSVMEFLLDLRSERVPAAGQLLDDTYQLLHAHHVEDLPGDTDSWLDFLQRELADITNGELS